MSSYPDFSYLHYQIIHELGRNREGGRISYLANCSDSSQQVVIKQFRFVQEGASWQGYVYDIDRNNEEILKYVSANR